MNTNSITQITNAAPQVQNALNAWHVVALGAGAYLAHTYHSIKAAGGIKNILRGLWDGDQENSPSTSAKATVDKQSNAQSLKSADANQKSKIENQNSL